MFEKSSYIKFHENPSNGSRNVPCGRKDGRADMTKPPTVVFRNFAIKKNGLYSQNISCISTNTSRYTNVTGCSGGNHMASGARGDGVTRVPTCVPSNVQRSYISLHRTAPSSDPRDSKTWKVHTECPRRNVPDFGRVFLMLKYTDITQNTYVQI